MLRKYKVKNLKTISMENSNHKRTKLIALLMLVIMLITITTGEASAVTIDKESTGGIQNIEYFEDEVLEDFRTHQNVQRSPQRTYIFSDTYELIKRYNSYSHQVTKWCNNLNADKNNTNTKKNSDKATELSGEWHELFLNLRNLYDTVSRSCFSSDSDGKARWRDYQGGKYTYGDIITNNDYNNIRKNISSYNSDFNKLITNLKQANQKIKENNTSQVISNTTKLMSGQYSVVTYMWKQLGRTLKDFGNGNARKGSNFFGISWGTNSMKKIANLIAPITKAFAYCLVVILFGLNMTNTMLQFEFTSPRGILRALGTLLIAKIWVDLSVTVCGYIVSTVNSMNSQLLNLLKINAHGVVYLSNFEPKTVNASSWNFIGTIISFFQGLFWRGPELVLIIALGFAIISVFIKILSRAFELTCLMAISPLAFACVANDEAKVYFKKFIGAFLSTCLYMTFMIICYAIGSQWLSEANSALDVATNSFFTNMKQLIPRFVIIFGICRIMAKPPKALTNLID